MLGALHRASPTPKFPHRWLGNTHRGEDWGGSVAVLGGAPVCFGGCPGLREALTCVVPRAVMLPVCTARCATPTPQVCGCGAKICVLTP